MDRDDWEIISLRKEEKVALGDIEKSPNGSIRIIGRNNLKRIRARLTELISGRGEVPPAARDIGMH
jgi:hypothetical protein